MSFRRKQVKPKALKDHVDLVPDVKPRVSSASPAAVSDQADGEASERSAECGVCGLSCATAELLLKHMDDEHHLLKSSDPGDCTDNSSGSAAADSFTCVLCTRVFDSVNRLQAHTLEKHSVQDLDASPNAPNFSLTSRRGRNKDSDDPTYECGVCARTFESILALHEHSNNGHPLPLGAEAGARSFACPQCAAVLPDAAALDAHARRHATVGHACDFCGAAFGTTDELDRHCFGHYLQKESQYACAACGGRLFDSSDQLQRHLIESHCQQLYRCTLCSELFDVRVDLQVHFAMSHCQELSQWRCRACNAAFAAQDQFEIHVHVVHTRRRGPKTLSQRSSPFAASRRALALSPAAARCRCPQCGLAFETEADYAEHRRSKCGAVHCCAQCPEAFATDHLLKEHQLTAHQAADASATEQLKKCMPPPPPLTKAPSRNASPASNDLALLTNAVLSQGGGKGAHKCNVCDEKYADVRDLAQHKLQHCKVFQSDACHYCSERLGSYEQFFSHCRRHGEASGVVSCVICRQSLVAPVEIHVHARFHLFGSSRGGGVDATACEECGSSFSSVDQLRAHRLSAHASKAFQCLKCQKSFASQEEINCHVATHVLQEGYEHHCALCQQVFDSPAKLQCHLIEHSFAGCKEFQCYLCGLVFSLAPPLQQHMQTHSWRERPFDCGACEQRFFFRAELNNHSHSCSRSRAPPPPHASPPLPVKTAESGSDASTAPAASPAAFACPDCDKKFVSMSALQGHSHIHKGARGHRCKQCGKCFGTAAKLRNHQRQHSANKPFPCDVCGRCFTRKDNLKAHQRIHARSEVNGLPTMVVAAATNRSGQEPDANDLC